MLQTSRRATLFRLDRWQQRLEFALRRWLRLSEPVEMCRQRFGYLPSLFRRRGLLYRVQRIERIWEQAERPYRAARRYFAVSCNDRSRYILFQNLQIGTWHLVGMVEQK